MCDWTLNAKQMVLRLVQVPQALEKGKNPARVQVQGTSVPGKKKERKNRFVQMKRFAERNETNASFKTQRPELKAAY